MIWLRKSLILAHRYLGIVLSLMFVMWFVTASVIGMIYSRGMPRLTPQVRLSRLAALDLAQVRLSPSEAVERAELDRPGARLTLITVMDRPATASEIPPLRSPKARQCVRPASQS